jgi:DUF3102 family protein
MNELTSVAAEINRLHTEIDEAARTTIDKAIRIGQLLSEQKRSLKHGQWLPWLEANVSFTDRTARNYLRVFEKREQLKLESVSDLTKAYRLLADKVTVSSPEVDEEVWDKLQFRLWKLERRMQALEAKPPRYQDLPEACAIREAADELSGEYRQFRELCDRRIAELEAQIELAITAYNARASVQPSGRS